MQSLEEDRTSLKMKNKLTVSSLEEEVVRVKLVAGQAMEEEQKASQALHEVKAYNAELVSV